jgi:GTP-binding protein HflX
MSERIAEPTKLRKERTFLVGIEIRGDDNVLNMEESLAELQLLAETAGLAVVGQTGQKLNKPYASTLIGPGKIEELKAIASETKTEVVLFDCELSPRHLRELEHTFGNDVRIIDRTTLILDIFAQHAHTNEGALQVELAQYEYRLPRLTRYWTHLARQAGGGGGRTGSVGGVGLRGPGETQLEVDRREIRRRISHLKGEIEKIRVHRQQHRNKRKRTNIPVIALVGYTNAGKSTLLNMLAGSDVYVADELFATLDPTTRRVELPGGHKVLVTDTVGFIQKLPTPLIAAFHATLEEINDADLLLHVVDITHPQAWAQSEAVYETLSTIGADTIPVLTAINKIDKLNDPNQALQTLAGFPGAVAISALRGDGINILLQRITQYLYEDFIEINLGIPYKEGGLITLFHEQGVVDRLEHTDKEVRIRGKIPARLVSYFRRYEKS